MPDMSHPLLQGSLGSFHEYWTVASSGKSIIWWPCDQPFCHRLVPCNAACNPPAASVHCLLTSNLPSPFIIITPLDSRYAFYRRPTAKCESPWDSIGSCASLKANADVRQNRDARSLLDVGLLFITEPNIRTVHILLQKFARIAIKKLPCFGICLF